MKKNVMLFGVCAATILGGCDDKNEKAITRDQQKENNPCVIEVPCNEPELESHYDKLYKYYDFCDSTVTVVGRALNVYGDSYTHQTRPIDELRGTEKQEMQQAYKRYQGLTQ